MLKSWFILSSSVVPLVMSATYEVIASETSASFARTTVYNVHCDGEPLSWRDVLKRWSVKDSSFLKAFTTALKRSSYADYYWECIPLNAATADNTFEFVLSDAGGSLCEDTASTSFFADKLYSPSYANLSVINFLNLGGDASLVVPKEDPQVDTNIYSDLASFVRGASKSQQMELWAQVAQLVEDRLFDTPSKVVWVSTHGHGVPWLHVRLDSKPKYISHRPYKKHRS